MGNQNFFCDIILNVNIVIVCQHASIVVTNHIKGGAIIYVKIYAFEINLFEIFLVAV